MTNKEKYEGKTVQIHAPFGGRNLGVLKVTEVMEDDILCGTIKENGPADGVETAYYLSDGIHVTVID